MKIKIAELLESSLALDLLWSCSECGSVNLSKQSITVQVDNQNKHASENAQKKIEKLLQELQQDDVTCRYDHADFTCRCDRCFHAEPWAKTYNKFFSYSIAGAILFLFLFVSVAVFSFSNFYKSLIRGETFGLFLLLAIVCSATILTVLIMLNKLRLNKLHQKISQLPDSSIPIISTHNSTRHYQFHQMRNNIAFAKDFEKNM